MFEQSTNKSMQTQNPNLLQKKGQQRQYEDTFRQLYGEDIELHLQANLTRMEVENNKAMKYPNFKVALRIQCQS